MKILAFIALVLLMTGCSGPDHVSVAEFKKEYAMAGQPQSMRHVTYLGVRDGRVVVQVSSMPVIGSEWKKRIIYVLVSELDSAFLRSLPPEPIQLLRPTEQAKSCGGELGSER